MRHICQINVYIPHFSSQRTCLKPRIHVRRMVRKPLANGSRTKCAYVWMGLRTCAAPSTNGVHTIRRKPKFVGFLRERKQNWMRLHALGVRCSPQVRGKLINHVPLMRCMRMVQRVSGALVYTKLYINQLRSMVTPNRGRTRLP